MLASPIYSSYWQAPNSTGYEADLADQTRSSGQWAILNIVSGLTAVNLNTSYHIESYETRVFECNKLLCIVHSHKTQSAVHWHQFLIVLALYVKDIIKH